MAKPVPATSNPIFPLVPNLGDLKFSGFLIEFLIFSPSNLFPDLIILDACSVAGLTSSTIFLLNLMFCIHLHLQHRLWH